MIPEGVTLIGGYAFSDCDNLTLSLYKDSYAEAYAQYNGIPYVLVVPKTIIYGDVDGDGELKAKDRIYLTRHLANWTDYAEIDKDAADLNCDGRVGAKDRIILTRHLANWTDYKTLPKPD